MFKITPNDFIEIDKWEFIEDDTIVCGIINGNDGYIKIDRSFLLLNPTNDMDFVFVGVDNQLYYTKTNGEKIEYKSIYYAHTLNIYNTPQEERDLELIKSLFPDKLILNPNTPEHQENYKTKGGMNYFIELVEKECDSLIFRSLPDGKIGAGVAAEIKCAVSNKFPIIELPNLFSSRVLSVEDTREYLKLIGQR